MKKDPVWKIANKDIPKLKKQITKLLEKSTNFV